MWLSTVQKLNKTKMNFKKSNGFELGSTHAFFSGNSEWALHILRTLSENIGLWQDGPLKAGEMGWKEVSTQVNAKSCIRGRTAPGTNTPFGNQIVSWKTALEKELAERLIMSQ